MAKIPTSESSCSCLLRRRHYIRRCRRRRCRQCRHRRGRRRCLRLRLGLRLPLRLCIRDRIHLRLCLRLCLGLCLHLHLSLRLRLRLSLCLRRCLLPMMVDLAMLNNATEELHVSLLQSIVASLCLSHPPRFLISALSVHPTPPGARTLPAPNLLKRVARAYSMASIVASPMLSDQPHLHVPISSSRGTVFCMSLSIHIASCVSASTRSIDTLRCWTKHQEPRD